MAECNSDSVSCTDEDNDSQSVCSSVSSITSEQSAAKNRPQSQHRNRKKKNKLPQSKRGIVWVGNLPSDTTSQELSDHFVSFRASICNKPTMHSPEDATNTATGGQNKFSFIHFTNVDKADEAVQAMNGSRFCGRNIKVQLKKKSVTNSTRSDSRNSINNKTMAEDKSVVQYSDDDNKSACSSGSSSIVSTDKPTTIIINSKSSNGRSKKGKKQSFSVSVHNLPPNCTPEQVMNHFASYKSDITNNVKIYSFKTSSQQKFTFLVFTSLNKAKEVIEKMNGTKFQQRRLNLKLQEPKKATVVAKRTNRSSTSSESSITQHDNNTIINTCSSVIVNPLLSVKVYNIPNGIDKDDLRGLVHLRNTSCIVNGATATLDFNTAEDASNAVKILNNKLLCGVRLCAELTESNSSHGADNPLSYSHSSSNHPLVSSYGHNPCTSEPILQPSLQGSTFGNPNLHSLPNASLSPHIIEGPPTLTPVPVQGRCPSHPHGYGPSQVIIRKKSSPNNEQYYFEESINSTASPSATIPNKHIKQSIPVTLYDMFSEANKTRIKEFEKNGGSIEYHKDIVSITSPIISEADSMVELFNTYSQKEISYTPCQWNKLVFVDESGKRLLDDIIEPFQYNPLVKIIEKPLKLIVVGLTDAVNGAYEHCIKNIGNDVDSSVKLETTLQEKIIEEQLVCTDQSQLVYLTKLFQSHNNEDLKKRLPAKCLLKQGKIKLTGTKEDITITTDKLQGMVPKYSKHVFEIRNTQFIKCLLEQYVLKTIENTIVIEEMAGKEKRYRVTVYIYDNDQTILNTIGEILKCIDPGVLFFTSSPKVKNIIKKILNDLEKQHRCCIDLMWHNSTKVAIHGLTRIERDKARTGIQDYIDQNYIITMEVPLRSITGLQMKYILNKHDEEIKELSRSLKSNEYPFELAKTFAFHIPPDQSAYFKVVGNCNAISNLENAIETFVDGFTVEKFCVSLNNIHRFPWRKRWGNLKQEAMDSHTTIIEYKLPNYDERHSVPVKFIIYGNQADHVTKLREIIESEVLAGTADGKLKLGSEHIKQLQIALKEKQLNFNDYMIEVKCVEKDEIVFINSLAVTADIVEVVKMEIINFIESTNNITEEVLFPNIQLFMIFKEYSCKKSTSIANKVNVSLQTFRHGTIAGVRLKGSEQSVNTVKDHLIELIEQSETLTSSLELSVLPLYKPAFTNTFVSFLDDKLLNDYYTAFKHVIPPPVRIQNNELKTVYIKLFSESTQVKISVCSGSIVTQTTDIIVNPTNPQLQNDSDLSKLITNAGGPIIQKQCNECIQQHGAIGLGDVMITDSGNLNCQKIVHAVVPQWNRGVNNDSEIIYTAIFNCLSYSEGYSSVSIPALGHDVPLDVCARMSLKAVRDFFCCHTETSLNKIVFVLLTKDIQDSFTRHVTSVFPSDSLLSKDNVSPSQQRSLPSTNMIETVWLWRGDNGHYSLYSSDISQQITRKHQQNPNDKFVIFINSSLYTIDLQQMVQINMLTKMERRIKMADSNTYVTWYWCNDNGNYVAYKSAESAQIESMHLSKSLSAVTINNQNYIFDFKRMVQINNSTGNKRQIQRKTAQYHVQQCAELPKAILKSNPILITLNGYRNNLELAKQFILTQLEGKLEQHQIDMLTKLDHGFTNKVEQISQKYKVMCETTSDSRVLCIKGIKIDMAIREIQQYIIEQQYHNTSEHSNTPTEWEQQSDTTQLYSIHKGSTEWKQVQELFNRTMADPIREIIRIQNKYLWERWVEERNRTERFKGPINEKNLFHGSGKTDPKLIYDSEEGFDMRFCTSGMWGLANYFAVNASYSNHYCHVNNKKEREMFLVRVITGSAYNCKPDKSLRMPPLKDSGSRLNLSQVRYDTVTGVTAGSQVYMSYDNVKAYPSYLIRY